MDQRIKLDFEEEAHVEIWTQTHFDVLEADITVLFELALEDWQPDQFKEGIQCFFILLHGRKLIDQFQTKVVVFRFCGLDCLHGELLDQVHVCVIPTG